MTVNAEIWDGCILVGPELHQFELMKTFPGGEYRDGRWTVPLAWASCIRLRQYFGDELVIWPKLQAWAGEFSMNVVRQCMGIRDAVEAEGDPRLYPFQRAGVAFIQRAQRVLIADEVGSGKTIQAIMAGLPKPVLVVAPKSMLFKWKREWEKWEPGFNVTVATGTASQRRKAIEAGDVVVINWENLAKHSRLAPFGGIALSEKESNDGDLNTRRWKSIIADEAHKAKNPRAKQTRALWAVVHHSQVEYAIGLTGTPIANQLDELWSIMHAIDEPEYPSKSKWVERYAETGWNMFGGMEIKGVKPERQAEFYSILDYRFRRMPKSITMPQLPPIRGGLGDKEGLDVREIEMDPKQAKAYKEMIEKMVAELESGTAMATRPVTKVLRAMQFAQAYAEVTDYQDEKGDWKQDFKLTEPSNKVDAVVDLLEEFSDEPIVFFAASRQLIDLCAARLTKLKISHGLIVGGQDAQERQDAIDMFQRGQLRAMLAVVAAGSTGIDLNRSRIEVVLQRSDSLVDNIQMEGRVHRIGSEIHDNVRIIDVVSRDTIEPRVVQRLYEKDDRLQEICRDEATFLKFIKGE